MTKQNEWKVSKVESTISVPDLPHKRFNADAERNLDARIITLTEFFTDEWKQKHITLEKGINSYEEAAVASLDSQIIETISNRQSWSRFVTDKQIKESFDNTKIILKVRSLPVISRSAYSEKYGIPLEAMKAMQNLPQFAGYIWVD